MRALPALLVLLLTAAPAYAQEDGPTDPDIGFPVIMVILIVVATVFALVWRAVSKKRSDR